MTRAEKETLSLFILWFTIWTHWFIGLMGLY